jgi:hypothetical protein
MRNDNQQQLQKAEHRAMATVVSGDVRKPPHEEDSSSDSVSTALDPVAPRHFTLNNIASQIELLDILIVAGVGTVLPSLSLSLSLSLSHHLCYALLCSSHFTPFVTLGHALKTGKLLNWIRKPWVCCNHYY